MKVIEDNTLLAHKRAVDAQRKAAALARVEAAKAEQQRANVAAMHRMVRR
jgi:hypothetical protein